MSLRLVIAAAAGLLQALALSNLGLAWLAWFSPGLILGASFGLSGKKIFQAGFVAGIVCNLLLLYWWLFIPFPVYAFLAWTSLSTILALFTAVWCWSCWNFFPNKPEMWPRRLAWISLSAATWVALEMAAARFLTGFPWNLLGISQFKNLAVIQITKFTGVYGVSYLIVCISLAGWWPFLSFLSGERKYRNWLPEFGFSLLLLSLVFGFGFQELSHVPETSRKIKIALIQPNIPQSTIWNPNEKTNRFNKLVDLSQQAATFSPDLLVWPEAALPDMLTRFNQTTLHAVTNLVLRRGLYMVMGANDSRTIEVNGKTQTEFFNSAFLINPAGDLVGRYHKRHLVPFGEFMPGAKWFSSLNRFRTLNSGFVRGKRPVTFAMPQLHLKTSVLICYEDTFPHLVREHVGVDTDFLLNLTNDGWFGNSAAQWRHAAASVFRAVENGLPLVRCTNNGLTCWIDSQGRLNYSSDSPDIYAAGFQLVNLPLPEKGFKQNATFYNRYGDLFGWSCVAVSLSSFLITVVPKVTRRKRTPVHGKSKIR